MLMVFFKMAKYLPSICRHNRQIVPYVFNPFFLFKAPLSQIILTLEKLNNDMNIVSPVHVSSPTQNL